MTTPEQETFQDSPPRPRRPRRTHRLEPVAIRLDEETLTQLREIAQERGIGPTTLARMWILEHLREQRRPTP